MGGGSWSTHTYTARNLAKAAEGKSTFDYSDTLRSTTPRSSWTVHESLDPKKVAGPASPNAGKIIRESMDSDEHPESTPIAVIFDVTGSMHRIPAVLQKKLPELDGLLMRKGYVEDPQILFGAVGDAYSDVVPLQIGQFESDNRRDEQLENIILEGGGGGGNHESYQLAAYYMARHTYLDSWEKRKKKGYLFLIGDERVYKNLPRQQVEKIIGFDGLQEDLTTEQIFTELKEKWEVFFLFASQGSYEVGDTVDDTGPTRYSYGYDDLGQKWRDLLGQNVIILEDADAVCETIAVTIGVMEGTISLEDGLEDLKEVGADLSAVTATGKALAAVGSGSAAVATASGELPGLDEGDEGAERL